MKIVSIDMNLARRDVPGIVDVMKSDPFNDNLQVKGSDGLSTLTLDGKSSEVVQLEGIRLVVEAMDRFKESVYARERGRVKPCRALTPILFLKTQIRAAKCLQAAAQHLPLGRESR